jgi:hypothetical protein
MALPPHYIMPCKEVLGMSPPKGTCLRPGERFAIVDELAPVRFLSRDEFEALKRRNPRLIQMRAGALVYLTEPPSKV